MEWTKTDSVKRVRDLEKENARLKKIVTELDQANPSLLDALRGKPMGVDDSRDC